MEDNSLQSPPHSKNHSCFASLAQMTVLLVGMSQITPSIAADAITGPIQQYIEPSSQKTGKENGWYIAGRISMAFAQDTEFATLGTQVFTAFDPGSALSGALGYTFQQPGPLNFRTEAELGYLTMDVDSHTIAGLDTFSAAAASGNTDAIYGLANGYVDYKLGRLTPFASLGLGVAHVNINRFGTAPTGTVLTDAGSGIAWQIGAGAAYSIAESWKLDLNYRYFGIEDVNILANDATGSDINLRSHQVILGLRKEF